jgi:hypothetical protein
VVKVKLPIIKVAKVLSEFGNRVYTFNSDCPSNGWVRLDLTGFELEKPLFFSVAKDNTVEVVVHACPQLPVDARYAWQPRLHEAPRLPMACPRCRYRLDYKPKRGS